MVLSNVDFGGESAFQTQTELHEFILPVAFVRGCIVRRLQFGCLLFFRSLKQRMRDKRARLRDTSDSDGAAASSHEDAWVVSPYHTHNWVKCEAGKHRLDCCCATPVKFSRQSRFKCSQTNSDVGHGMTPCSVSICSKHFSGKQPVTHGQFF